MHNPEAKASRKKEVVDFLFRRLARKGQVVQVDLQQIEKDRRLIANLLWTADLTPARKAIFERLLAELDSQVPPTKDEPDAPGMTSIAGYRDRANGNDSDDVSKDVDDAIMNADIKTARILATLSKPAKK